MSVVDLEKYARPKTRSRPEPERAPDPRVWLAGVPQPTQLEIAEGRAYRTLLLDPDNEELIRIHGSAWNALMTGQRGNVGLLRCGLCQTTKWGMMRTAPCVVCKSRAGYYG